MSSLQSTPLSSVLELHPALEAAWRAGWAAGLFLRDERPADLVIDTKSTPTDVVSVMDRGAEALIVEAILGQFPDDGFLGEESGERPSSSGRRWVVDPLDATVNYLYRIPLWGVSIALEDSQGTVLGVVVLPALDQAYVAVRGKGSWRIDHGRASRLAGSSCARLSQALVSTGFGYSAERRVRQAEVAAQVIGRVRDLRRSGCAVIDFCWLAEGRTDGYYEYGLNPWDHAAAALVCREAGVIVTGFDGGSSLDPAFVAGAPLIFEELRDLLLASGAGDMP
jgi:myo-inositol-1(or 4)-monophosphatase